MAQPSPLSHSRIFASLSPPPNRNPKPVKQSSPNLLSPQLLETTHLLSAPMTLPSLNTSYKRSHAIFMCKNRALKGIQILIFGNLWVVISVVERTLLIWLSMLRWGNYRGFPELALNVTTRIFLREAEGDLSREEKEV